MARTLKPNAQEFTEALRRHHRHRPAFHWTPLSNLPGILQHGILCRSRLELRDLTYTAHGYGRAGKEAEFADHVCVSLYPQKGMMRRASEPQALFEVKPELLYVDGAFYCPGNSAKNEYDFEELVKKTALDDLEELFEGPTEWRLKDWQAEIWIPGYIHRGDIVRVLFASDGTRQQAVDLCRAIAEDLPKDITFAVGAAWHFPEPPEGEAEAEDTVGELEDDPQD